MVRIVVHSGGASQANSKKWPLSLEVSHNATVADIKSSIFAQYPKLTVERQKVSVKNERKALSDDRKLSDIFSESKVDGGELQVKDLGPQVSWKLVFLIEYIGPLIIHPIFYFFPKAIYGQAVEHSLLQNYVFAFVMLHFLKRELETLFVHRFSNGTMPIMNIFRNSAHYHLLSGLLLAIDIYRPKYSATSSYILGTYRNNKDFLYIAAGIWAFAELSNFHTHMNLRSLRPAGTRTRAIPFGYGFSLVSCPNYFFESIGWIVICGMTNSLAAYLFTVVATYIMAEWALKKHRNYKAEFGKMYPRNRTAMFPFVL